MIGGLFSNSIVTRVGRGLNARSAVDCSSGGLITDCQIVDGYLDVPDEDVTLWQWQAAG